MFAKAEFVAVSDIHMRHADDDRGQVLLDVIDACAEARVPCFALLGDIFDFCLGSGAYFREKFARIGERLESLAARGTRVFFVEGNHEFNMAGMGWRGVEFVSETPARRGHAWTSPSGARLVMTHGDLFNAPASYLAFRSLIKAAPTLTAVSMVPGKLMDAYALGHAKVSRSRDPYRTLDESAIFEDARKFALEQSADHLLFGHFHMPWAVPVARTGDQLMLCMDSWDKPNLLLFDGREFHRGFSSGPGRPLEFYPALGKSLRGDRTQSSDLIPR